MSSHASIGFERKIEHTFFLLSVWSKGVAGLLETIGGREYQARKQGFA
jgi:hypothetical protein